MSEKICPDTGDACTCDGNEPCSCGCGCGHSAEEERAAAAFRDARHAAADAEAKTAGGREPERMIVVSFDSTFDVMECERLCLEAHVPGRIIPLPGSITAGCGLCWAMPLSGEALAAFRDACEGRVEVADYHQLLIPAF